METTLTQKPCRGRRIQRQRWKPTLTRNHRLSHTTWMLEISHWWNREGLTKPVRISNLNHTQSWMSKVPWSLPDKQLIRKKSPTIAPISRNYQTYQEVPYLTANQYPPMSKCHSPLKDQKSEGPEICQSASTSTPQEESSQIYTAVDCMILLSSSFCC